MSLYKNNVYCAMPRSSRPPDTYKWGGPKLALLAVSLMLLSTRWSAFFCFRRFACGYNFRSFVAHGVCFPICVSYVSKSWYLKINLIKINYWLVTSLTFNFLSIVLCFHASVSLWGHEWDVDNIPKFLEEGYEHISSGSLKHRIQQRKHVIRPEKKYLEF